MIIELHPLKEQVEQWVRAYVPEKDLFFIRKEDIDLFTDDLQQVLVIPREEFFGHSSYNHIQLFNSYEYWKISKDAAFIFVAHPNWITHLSSDKRKALLKKQVEVGRGLKVPLSLFSDQSSVPKEYVVSHNDESIVVLQREMWDVLTFECKEHVLTRYAQEWDDWSGCEAHAQTPIHIKKYANTFPSQSGSNCLSAALFAITQQEWMIHEWVHQKTFLETLKNANYQLVDAEWNEGDVVTWVNSKGVIQHASYCLGHGLFFNKNGQTFFNPWRIVDWGDLKDQWDGLNIKAYRKRETN